MIKFTNKTALVTGGTRGIGKRIVELLADSGCRVIFTGTRQKNVVDNDRLVYMQLDLSDKTSTGKFISRVRKIPKIDILINNSGINIIEPIDKLNQTNWEKILNVNLTGPMLLTKEVAVIMKKNKTAGRILNISSMFGVISKARRNSYSASKAGLIGLTRSSALDLAPYNILVNALCPGFTMTDMTASILSPAEIKQLSSEIPLGRFADEEEIAKIAVFLCSDLNTYMTGQAVIADGGFTIQ